MTYRRLFGKIWSSGSFGAEVGRAGMWSFLLRIATRLLKLLEKVVLARLLTPTDFGLLGLGVLATSGALAFSRLGVRWFVVQHDDIGQDLLNTAWTVRVLRGLAIAVVLVLSAESIAGFFQEPAAAQVIRVMALTVVLDGFQNIKAVFFQRRLEFRKEFIFKGMGALSTLVVAVGVALFLRQDVWALVTGSVAGSLWLVGASFVMIDHRVRLRLKRDELSRIISFGRWLQGSAVLHYATDKGDDILVGRILGTGPLGLYQVAFQLASLAVTEVTNVVERVALPAYAEVERQGRNAGRAFLDILEAIAYIVLPLGAVTVVLADPLVRLILGDQWLEAIPVIRILTIAGVVRALTGESHFVALSVPSRIFYRGLFRVVILAGAIVPGIILYDVAGAAGAVALAWVGSLPLWWKYTSEALELGLDEAVRRVALPGLMMVGVVAVASGLHYGLVGELGLTATALGIVGGVLAYAVVAHGLWVYRGSGPIRLVVDIVGDGRTERS